MNSGLLNGRWSATQAGTNAATTATKAAVTGKVIVVDHISGHADTDALLTLKSAATVLAEWKIDVSLEGFMIQVPQGLWMAGRDEAVTAVLSASTADCQVNIAGFTL